jgi:hypothetical protein
LDCSGTGSPTVVDAFSQRHEIEAMLLSQLL